MTRPQNCTDTITIPSRDGQGGFGRAVTRNAVRTVNLLLMWQARIRERHLLACLDDHGLKDIGLSRADVQCEIDKPFWRG